MKNYGNAIKKLRKNADITQAQLAAKLNVSSQTVSKWENGVNLPDISAIEDMCALFGVSLEEFSKLADGGSISASAPVSVAPVALEVPAAPAAPAVPAAPATPATIAVPAALADNGKKNLLIIILIVVLCAAIVVSALIGIGVTVVKPLLSGFKGNDTSGKKIYEKVNPSVFCITVKTEDDTLGGSGFFIDSNGTAVTNYHVINGIKSATVKLYNGEEYEVDKILGHDTVRDVAIIHVNAPKTVPARLADSDRISTGDKVYAIGYPESFVLGSLDSTMTDGIISKTSYSIGGVRYIQSTVDITHGNSGGVLLNSSGEVIGITTAGIDLGNVTYMNLSVPSNVINGVKRDIDMSVANYASVYSKKITVTYILDGMRFAVKTVCVAESVPCLTVDLTSLGEEYADCEFLGWYADAEYAEPFDFNSAVADEDFTLYGKLRFKQTTVEYSVQSNEVGVVEGETVRLGGSFTLPENVFRKTGFNFNGWKIGGKSYAPGDEFIIDGTARKLTVEADWVGILYTVRFSYLSQPHDEEYRYGDTHRLPAALYTRTGYNQTGWQYQNQKYGLKETAPDFTSTENAVVIVVPVWTPITYRLRLDFGRDVTFQQKEYDYGEYAYITGTYGEDPLPENKKPNALGLEFNGWTVYSADGSVYEGDMRFVNANPAALIRAKANWISGTYRLQLYDFGTTTTVLKDVQLSGNEEYTLPLFSTLKNATHLDGYHFVCWENSRTDIELDEEIFYQDGETVSDLMLKRFIHGSDRYGRYGYFVKLEAVREPNGYTVNFDGNGGSGSIGSINCVYGEESTLPANTFIKDGYVFGGWQCDGRAFADQSVLYELNYPHGAELTFTAVWIKEYEGEGTYANPYKVSDFEQLKNLSRAVEYMNGYDRARYELTADIDCAGGELNAIGYNKSFKGVFDGNGHIISDVTFAATIDTTLDYHVGYKGLFGCVFGGQVLNTGIKDYVISGKEGCRMFAPLVCEYISTKPLTDCFAEGSISWQDGNGCFAGLVYRLSGSAVNCYAVSNFDMQYTKSAGEVGSGYTAGDLYIGGFVGNMSDGMFSDEGIEFTVNSVFTENCYADTHVNISVAAGVAKTYRHYTGLFAAESGAFKNCFATGEITYNCASDFLKSGSSAEISCFVTLFDGSPFYPVYDNVFVAESAQIVFTDKTVDKVPEPQQKTADDNLCSLEWLKENAEFDDGVWQETAGGLPTLKAFAQ